MNKEINIWEFDPNNCEAMKEPEKFLDDWCTTNSNPCSKCGKDKSTCHFYKNLS